MTRKILFGVCILFLASSIFATNNCHPKINNNVKNYLIGYGSLMQSKSRQRTLKVATDVYPIMIKGFERTWGIHGGHYKTTFLTLIKNPKLSLNAIYYYTNNEEIQKTDQRESGYCRIQIAKKNISPLGLSRLPLGTYWVYAQKNNSVQLPTTQYPIVQSYVDIFIDGCMNVAQRYQLKSFSKQCVTHTTGWPKLNNNLWINDREFARRPFNVPNAFKIDKFLATFFKNYYNHKIE